MSEHVTSSKFLMMWLANQLAGAVRQTNCPRPFTIVRKSIAASSPSRLLAKPDYEIWWDPRSTQALERTRPLSRSRDNNPWRRCSGIVLPHSVLLIVFWSPLSFNGKNTHGRGPCRPARSCGSPLSLTQFEQIPALHREDWRRPSDTCPSFPRGVGRFRLGRDFFGFRI